MVGLKKKFIKKKNCSRNRPSAGRFPEVTRTERVTSRPPARCWWSASWTTRALRACRRQVMSESPENLPDSQKMYFLVRFLQKLHIYGLKNSPIIYEDVFPLIRCPNPCFFKREGRGFFLER